MTPLKNNRGGMLIDLLVAFGIIALLSTISIPYLKKYQPNLKLNAAARNLATDLRYAQQLTVTEQKVYAVAFDVSGKKYDVLKLDIATTTIKTVSLDQDLSYGSITGLTDNLVGFNYYGGVSQSGSVTLTNINGLNAVINIKPSGYVQLEE